MSAAVEVPACVAIETPVVTENPVSIAVGAHVPVAIETPVATENPVSIVFRESSFEDNMLTAGLAGAAAGFFFMKNRYQLHYPAVGFLVGITLPISLPVALLLAVSRVSGWFTRSLDVFNWHFEDDNSIVVGDNICVISDGNIHVKGRNGKNGQNGIVYYSQ